MDEPLNTFTAAMCVIYPRYAAIPSTSCWRSLCVQLCKVICTYDVYERILLVQQLSAHFHSLELPYK